MRKIHIALVGGQPAPVYNGIMYAKPDKVVFIYSDASRENVEAIEREIQFPSEKRKVDPVDFVDIEKKVKDCVDSFSNDEVTVNITSGTKSWSYFFTEYFGKSENAQVFYVDQNYVVWNFTKRTQTNLEFDIFTHFRLYGNELTHYRRFEDYTDEDVNALTSIERIRKHNYGDFIKLCAVLDKKNGHELKSNKEGVFELDNGSYVEWTKGQDGSNDTVFISLNSKNYGYKEEKIESPHAIDLVFNSGWFEFKIARLLSKWSHCKELYLNCRFPFKADKDKNEVDIIVNTGKKPLFVECKTQVNNNTDVDKFNSVIDNYGGLGSMGLFITEICMEEIARQKCEDHNILTFSLKNSDKKFNPENQLWSILDNAWDKINSK